jgi:hypothetical protein
MLDGTPLIRAWSRRRIASLARIDPAATQQDLLLRLLARARETRFGRAHGFATIRDVASFQARVPLRRYEAFWEEWWKQDYPILRDITWPGRMPYIALSSGTTAGRTKRLPVSAAMMRANRGAAFDILAWHLHHHPASRPLDGRALMLGGSTALDLIGPGVRAGDLSGIVAHEAPLAIRPWLWPPERLALMPDWDSKIAALAMTTPRPAIRLLSGTPSWLLMLLDRMAEAPGAPPFPRLELLIHGGVAWSPYRARIAPYLPPGCMTREVYAASEGFIAIADRGDGEGLRLNLDRGVFYEFVPLGELDRPNPTRHWAATIETGIDYAVVMTTVSGLHAYIIGDVVRFIDRSPPRLILTGRTAWTLSAFGEHLQGHEVVAALDAACEALRIAPGEWCCGPEFLGAQGRHHFLLEATGKAEALAALLDQGLMGANAGYAAHRRDGQLLAPRVTLMPPGRFEGWMRATGQLGGQHKVPHIIADPARFAAAAALLAPAAALLLTPRQEGPPP